MPYIHRIIVSCNYNYYTIYIFKYFYCIASKPLLYRATISS